MDDELVEELKNIKKTDNENDNLEESRFIANCLRIGLRIEDLKQMEYKEVAKILLCFREKPEPKYKKATQSDWDKLAGM